MADMNQYKCPCCGGAVSFDSSLQKIKCPFCDTTFDVDTFKAFDKDLNEASAQDKINWETSGKIWQDADEEGMRVYICKSCGGQIIGDANMGATNCPYCGNPVVMMGQFKGDLKPDYIIPFKLDKEAAKAALKKHYKGKPFIPKDFVSNNKIEEIKGIYVPFWLFDTRSHGNVHFKATKVRTWQDSRFRYTETKFYSIIRQGGVSFEKIPFDGSSKMADDLMESIEPFDFKQAVDFKTAFMAGYLADKYDVDVDQSKDRINQRIKASTEEALRSTVNGYTTVNIESSSVVAEKGKVSYAMYPVWLLNTLWNGQTYTFAMNGQTGKMVGDIPIDKKKRALWTVIIGVLSVGVGFLIALLLEAMGIF